MVEPGRLVQICGFSNVELLVKYVTSCATLQALEQEGIVEGLLIVVSTDGMAQNGVRTSSSKK